MSTDGERPLTRRELRETAERDAAPDVDPTPQDTEPEFSEPEAAEPRAAQPTAPLRRSPRRGRFLGAFAAIVGVLAVLGLTGAVVGTIQGPRVTSVQVDPAAAVQASGSRLIVTTSQSLQTVEADQVVVEPAVPFAVDTSGRALGVRFGMPLDDDTEYTVTFRDVVGLGGGRPVTLVETFRTPPIELYLLSRSSDGGPDAIFRTDLTGEKAVKVFERDRIEDFRTTARHLVVSLGGDESGELVAVDLSDGTERVLPLPGGGVVANLQAADRGERIGYTFSSADPAATDALESVLFTMSLADTGAEPQRVAVQGADPRVGQWRFVPDTDSVLLLNFEGSLLLANATGDDATSLGTALSIDGIAGTTAIIERLEDVELVDLADGSSEPLTLTSGEGVEGDVLPVPGGGTLRTIATLDERGMPTAQRVAFVTDEGADETVLAVGAGDALLQTCMSPSGRYAAIAVAPDIVDNPYDRYALPLPERVETHIVQIADGAEVVALAGTAVSWCRIPPL